MSPRDSRDDEPRDDGFASLEDEIYEDAEDMEGEARLSRLSRLARRVLNRRELAEDTREILTAVAETSDWAKSEMVRLVAREVRIYLDELNLKEDLADIARSHTLEVQMSLTLKPLAEKLTSTEGEGEEG